MSEESKTTEQLQDLPYLEVPRPEEAGTHPSSTPNMPPMKTVPEELLAVASRTAAPGRNIAKLAEPPKQPVAKPLPKPENDPGIWGFGRRNFLQAAGWMSFFGFITVATVGALRMMFPRTLYEPPTVFKAGIPSDYLPMSVSEKYKDDQRVWICRDEEKLYALVAICTHLGCTPRWLASEAKFKCPCHGSGFHMDGMNFEGPAPRPLERAEIALSPDGQLVVDSSKKFLFEKGEWDKPESFVKV